MKTYEVAGIASFSIRAKSASEAIKKAQRQADRLSKGRLEISLDNWSCDEAGISGTDINDTDKNED